MIRPSLVLAQRALRNAFRRPQFLAPLVAFPCVLLAVNTGGLEQTTRLDGFPEVEGFLDFQLAGAISQSLLLGGVTAGIATALEIEGGFFDRLVASPIPRTAIVLGRLIASGVLSALQILFFLAVGLIFGAEVQGGVLGAVLVVLIGSIAGMGFASIGLWLAFRAKSAALVQGIFPIVFVILFLSSAFFPRGMLEPPAEWAADYNPLSYIADGMRDPIISSVTTQTVLEGLGAATAVAVLMFAFCLQALRGRLTDT